jgi:hypothetical protein
VLGVAEGGRNSLKKYWSFAAGRISIDILGRHQGVSVSGSPCSGGGGCDFYYQHLSERV